MLDLAVADFSLPATGGETFTLSAQRGHPVVLYFYPKDNTPGCTNEALAFAELYPEFVRLGACLAGISRDSLAAHEKFREKYALPFLLLSDREETVCRQFDVIRTKTLYGKTVQGIERSTFLIDGDGVLRHAWRAVKVPGHAQDVLDRLRTL